jgi:hypothetical protein
MSARQQLEQQQSQSVNISRRRDRIAGELLRGGAYRRQRHGGQLGLTRQLRVE